MKESVAARRTLFYKLNCDIIPIVIGMRYYVNHQIAISSDY